MNVRTRRLFLKIAILVMATVVCCAVAEVVLRVASPIRTFVSPLGSFHQFDPEVGWVGMPHWTARFQKPDFNVTIRANAEGFRDRQSTVSPRPGSPIVAVFGDSFTWGWGVENGQVFTDVMQNQWGAGADVRNFGMDAYGTLQELLLFERCLTNGLRPRYVLVMFYQNDFYDNIGVDKRRPWILVTGTNTMVRNLPVTGRAMGPWNKVVKSSYLLSSIGYLFDFSKEKKRIANLEQSTFTNNAVAAEPQAAMGFCLDRFREVCDTNRIKLAFIYVPGLDDVRSETPTQSRVALKSLCDQRGIRLIDLTQNFREASGTQFGRYFFAHDRHWTAQGHELAGKALAEILKNEVLVDNPPATAAVRTN